MPTIEEIYSRIPKIDCQRKCQSCCSFILMSDVEATRIDHLTGPINFLAHPCPALSVMGDCTIYDNRPAICRLYGVVRRMTCPHGCQPETWLSDAEAKSILEELMEL